jgi:FkbM family methyltransferase
MWMPFSHDIPAYLEAEGHYDSLLPRIYHFIENAQGRVCGIDVGANIGDTIAAGLKNPQNKFLAIEANPLFFSYLKKNLGAMENVRLHQALCTSEDAVGQFDITTVRGTARFEKSASNGLSVDAKKLDTLIEEYPEFENCNFLKIDTDGYDFEVLRGGRELIRRVKPIVLFECDVFKNTHFIQDVAETLSFFFVEGYETALLYDNGGELLGQVDAENLKTLHWMLFYQATSQRFYLDVLLIPSGAKFLSQEFAFFISETSTFERRLAAENAARLLKVR